MPRRQPDDVPLDMTPMIDIVFQLLAFFVMTFRIAQVEGDFNITMPRLGNGADSVNTVPPLTIRLQADADGDLREIRLGNNTFANFRELHGMIAATLGPDRGPGSLQAAAEAELACDERLKYEHVIAAVTAVAGEIGTDGRPLRLIEKIRFAPPHSE